MISAKTIKKFNTPSKLVTIKSLDDECNIKKFTIGDTLELKGKNGDDLLFAMVMIGVLDEKGERVFPTVSDIHGMPTEVVTELVEHVSDYNSESDPETQAKKS